MPIIAGRSERLATAPGITFRAPTPVRRIMLLPELRTLARTKSIRPQTRLRVLIEAAPRALEVATVSAYLHAQCVPYGRSIVRARERLDVPSYFGAGDAAGDHHILGDTEDQRFRYVRDNYRWWPFHFSGVYDRVPLFASLEPHRGTKPFTTKDSTK